MHSSMHATWREQNACICAHIHHEMHIHIYPGTIKKNANQFSPFLSH